MKKDSFISIFENAMSINPDKKAIIIGDNYRTYREIFENARKIAGYLRRSGIVKNDPVAIISNNSVDYFETELGCIMAGAIVIKLNWRLAVPELHHLLIYNKIKFVFFRAQDEAVCQEMKALTKTVSIMNMDHMKEQLEKEVPMDVFVERADQDVLMHLHTSGTTGIPKVVRYTNAQFVEKLKICMQELLFDQDTVFQIMSQMFHSANIGVYACLGRSGTVVTFGRFNPEEYLASVQKNHVTRMSAIPTVLTALMNCPNLDCYDVSSVRMISYSTCPMPPALIRRAIDKFDCQFQQSYGMTEMGAVVTVLSPDDHIADDMKHLNSIGKPLKGHDVKVVNERGDVCAVGEVGELCVKGPGVMLDYYQMPLETAEAIKDGWYYTKDMGYQDEDGYLYLCGRKNDMIISGGENIFPQEIEHVLRMNPVIAECAVVGVTDTYWGEAVHAFVSLKENQSATEKEIREYCRGKIAGYKIPKKVHILQELPRTATGKIQKPRLIEWIMKLKK